MKTMSKKKKIIILSVMIALLLVTGFVNVALNSTISSGAATTTSAANANFYTSYRAQRESTRAQEIEFYDSIIQSSASSEDSKKEAEANKLALITQMEKELITEGIIRGRGFEDAVITTSSSNINVFIKCAQTDLTQIDAIQIAAVVSEQLKVELDKIFIIPSE